MAIFGSGECRATWLRLDTGIEKRFTFAGIFEERWYHAAGVIGLK
jgi:hypothetical protein